MEKAPSTKLIPFIILQIGFGALVSFSSWLLAIKARLVPLVLPRDAGILYNSLPSETKIEIGLIMLGIAVIASGSCLKKAHVKFAGWQVMVGALVTALSGGLSLGLLTLQRAGTLAFNYADILLVLGLILSILGIIQLIFRLSGDLQAIREPKLLGSRYPARGLVRRPAG
jgi:hypothetical protein